MRLVGTLVPPGIPIQATHELGEPEFLVLAYRLGGRLERVPVGCATDGYLLVSAGMASALELRGYATLARVERPRASVALLREPRDVACPAMPRPRSEARDR